MGITIHRYESKEGAQKKFLSSEILVRTIQYSIQSHIPVSPQHDAERIFSFVSNIQRCSFRLNSIK